MKRLYGLFISIMGLGICMIPQFGYTECSACTDSPSEFEEYIEVMEELIKYDIPIGGSGNVQKTNDRFERARLVADQHLKDIAPQIEYASQDGELKLLEQTKVRSRDYNKLLELDAKILQKLGEFGLVNEGKALNGGLMKSHSQRIDAILQPLKFIRLSTTNRGYALDQLNYVEYLGMLRRLNGLIKHLHRDREWFHTELYEVGKGTLKAETKRAQDTIDSVEKQYIYKPYNDLVTIGERYVVRNTKDGSNPPAVFTFVDDYQELLLFAWTLQRKYECTLGVRGVCERRKDTAESSRNQVRDRWQNDSRNAAHTFTEAWGRLKEAFWSADSDAEKVRKERRESVFTDSRANEGPERKKWRKVVRPNFEEEEVSGSPVSLTNWTRRIFESKKETKDRIEREGGHYNVWGELVSTSTLDQPEKSPQDNPGNANTKEKRKRLLESAYVGYFDKRERTQWKANEIDTRTYFVAGDSEREKLAIQNTMIGVLNLQRSLDIHTIATDVSVVTKGLPNLSDTLHVNAAIRGDKHDDARVDKPSIYATAQSVCTNQCRNITDKQCGAQGE